MPQDAQIILLQKSCQGRADLACPLSIIPFPVEPTVTRNKHATVMLKKICLCGDLPDSLYLTSVQLL